MCVTMVFMLCFYVLTHLFDKYPINRMDFLIHNVFSLHICHSHLFFVKSIFSMANSSRNPKHLWTKAVESCLVDCLVDLVNMEGGRAVEVR